MRHFFSPWKILQLLWKFKSILILMFRSQFHLLGFGFFSFSSSSYLFFCLFVWMSIVVKTDCLKFHFDYWQDRKKKSTTRRRKENRGEGEERVMATHRWMPVSLLISIAFLFFFSSRWTRKYWTKLSLVFKVLIPVLIFEMNHQQIRIIIRLNQHRAKWC